MTFRRIFTSAIDAGGGFQNYPDDYGVVNELHKKGELSIRLALVGIRIALLGTATGGSLNPARQFGPAAVSGQTQFLWVYLLAPLVGAAVAAWLRSLFQYFLRQRRTRRVAPQSDTTHVYVSPD